MLSMKTKRAILQAGAMASIAIAGMVVTPTVFPSYIAEAANLGEITVKASSIWTYNKPEWSARAKVFKAGETFSAIEKITLSDGEMYKLSNGLYITANPKYVSLNGNVPTVSTPSAGETKSLMVTANLNLRKGTSTGYGIILTIPKGTTVEHISTASNGWHEVRYNGKIGYVSPSYVKLGASTQTPTPTPTPPPVSPPAALPSTGKMYKTTSALNMRSGDSVSHGVVLTLPKGANVDFIEVAPSGWYKVQYGNKSGFVNPKYLTETTVSENTTPTPETPANPSTSVSYATVNVGLNLRSGASTSHSVLLTMPKGTKVDVLEKGSSWSKIKYNGREGYASNKYLTFHEVPNTGTVTTPDIPQSTPPPAGTETEPTVPGMYDNHALKDVAGSHYMPIGKVEKYEVKTKIAVNMRSGAGIEHGIVTVIPKNVSMLREEVLDNGWVKVTYEGSTGYINGGEANVFTIPVVWKDSSAFAKIKRDTPNKPIGISAIENALTQLGQPYQWGAEGPIDYDRDGDTRPGFDCSGLTQWAYFAHGKSIPRTTATGYNKGTQISRENVQPGDLLYFKTTNSSAPVTHVAMYLGDNMMLHASSSLGVTGISGVYWQHLVSIVRY